VAMTAAGGEVFNRERGGLHLLNEVSSNCGTMRAANEFNLRVKCAHIRELVAIWLPILEHASVANMGEPDHAA